ncbi:hypothetical protein N431DRAFT_490974 [Stipitochalara longipes BDJ]|nr:hypothetical protein N431DRAFT_490974 [Stipitochalara longipes BDJ]
MARTTAIHASQPKAATSAGPSISRNVRDEPLIDFHCFTDLAPELQDAVWEFSCYSTPEIVPIFIDDRTFSFRFRNIPAVPTVLHATSGARAIGLRHFVCVKFEELNRNTPRPPPQPQVHPPQGAQQTFHHQIANIPAQLVQNHLALQTANYGLGFQGHGWANITPGNPQPALLTPAPQPQSSNPWAVVTFNAQAALQAQHHSQNLGTVHQQGQQSIQAQGPLSWFQNHAVQPFANVGGPQQTTSQVLGTQNNSQQGSHYQAQGSFGGSFHATLAGTHSLSQNVVHYQSTFSGSQQTSAMAGPSVIHNSSHHHSHHGGSMQSNAVGQHNGVHHGTQQQNIFGGSFQPAPAGQQPTSQIGPPSHVVGQVTTMQIFNPSASTLTAFAALTNITNAAISNNPQPRQRLLPVGDDTNDGSDRYFYVNPRSDLFKLQVGARTGYNYPTYGLTRFPHILTPINDEDRQAYMQHIQQTYALPTAFPASGRLPNFLAGIQHLVLNLELAPCHAPMRSDGFRTWLHDQTKKFCEVIINSTIKKFRSVKNLDLLIERASYSRPAHAHDQMVLRHFRQAPIQQEDGITFGHAELGLLEREIRVWMMSEYMGKNGPEGPEVRIVVHMPNHYS